MIESLREYGKGVYAIEAGGKRKRRSPRPHVPGDLQKHSAGYRASEIDYEGPLTSEKSADRHRRWCWSLTTRWRFAELLEKALRCSKAKRDDFESFD